jgi:hypothetical protein
MKKLLLGVCVSWIIFSNSLLAQTMAKVASSVAVSGSSFESPVLAARQFQYSPSSSDWIFGTGSGISANGSGFTGANPNAPVGAQVAFIQGAAKISKSISVATAGNYSISLLGAQRTNNNQTIGVYIDNALVAELKAANQVYQLLSTSTISLSAGNHSLEFRGLNPAGGDNTMFIDDVKISGQTAWSNPASWNGGVVPGAGSDVEIPYGVSMLLDANATIKSLMVNGSLTADQTKDLTLTTNWIMIHGALTWGTPSNPYTKKGKIILTGTNTSESIMGMGTKLIGTMGSGVMNFHGKPKKSWTMLNASASAGATSIVVQDAVDWEVGDAFIISSTNTENDLDKKLTYTESEKRIITSISADRKTITFSESLKYDHYGKLQTFTNGTRSWVLDERAEVGLITRNLVIMGDAASESIQFGGHMMSMNGSKAYISGVELFRMGQAGVLGRYPFHWHLAGNVSGEYIKNCSVHHSFQRAITVHGAQNATVEDNVCYDIKGHGIFLEDGNESNTLIKNNLVVWVHKPDANKVIRPSDVFNLPSRIDGPAGIWVSHPTNDLIGNAVSSCGSGIWYAILDHPDGPSYDPNVRINTEPLGNVDGNRTHACYSGFIVDFADVNNRASTEAVHYHAPAGQVVKNATSFDCMRTLWWRGNHATFENFMTSNSFTHQGANVFTFYGTFKDGLMVGHTDKTKKKAFMSYGTSMYDGNHELIRCHFENFDQHDQALLTMIGGASKNLPLTMENCSKKNSRVMHLSTTTTGNPEEFNSYSSMIWDKTGEILGAANRWAVLDHPYLRDNTFLPIDNLPSLGGYTTNTGKFARVRFVIHDITEQTKSTLYSDWADGNQAHNRPLGPHWEMPVMVNSSRLYRFRMTDYTPKKMTLSFGEARAGDKIRFFIEGFPVEMNVVSNPEWPYNNGTPLRRVSTLAEYNAATDNVYLWINGRAYFHLVARYTNDERTENIMISSPNGAQLNVASVPSRPYKGVRHTPGMLVQAEHFDHGGQGVGYFEKKGNDYLTIWEFKNSDHIAKRHGEMVDLTRVSPQSENFVVSDIKTNEWWNYSYTVSTAGSYSIKLGVASTVASNSFRVLLNGSVIATKNFAATSGISIQEVGPFNFSQGNHVIRVEALTDGFTFDWLSVNSTNVVAGAPVITITNPLEGAKNSGTISFSATASDPTYGTANGAGISSVKFELKKENVVVATTTDVSVPYTWSYNSLTQNNGLYQLVVTANSQDNQTTVKSMAVSIENPYDCAGVLNGTAFMDGCGKCSGGTTNLPICADTLWEEGFELMRWNHSADASFAQTSSTILVTATGGNCHFWSPDNVYIPTSDFRYYHIRMKNSGTKTQGRMSWFYEDGTSAGHSYSIAAGDSEFIDYVLDMRTVSTYKGVIKRILLQPTAGSDIGQVVTIDRIEFSRVDRRDCNGVWRGTAKMDNCNSCVGGNTGRVSAPGCDPSICAPVPYSAAISLPGTIEAENFDRGGQNCSFYDADAANQGGHYRISEAVDIEVSSEGGYNIGWIGAGEWTQYTVTIAQARSYDVSIRASAWAGASVRMELNGVKVGSSFMLTQTGGLQTYANTTQRISLPAGTHALKIVVESAGFNLDKVLVSLPVNLLPTVSLTAPLNNTSYRAPATIVINANAADADGTISKVEFFNGATLLGSDLTAPYSFSWTNVAAGTYRLTAKATDNAGSTSTSTAITVLVNPAANVLPTVSLTSPLNNSTFNAPATINITANASDADGTISKVEFFNGATLLGSDLTAPYSFSWTNVAAGTYRITAKATDNGGGVATSSAITVVVNPAANVLPTVSLTSPLNNSTFNAPATINIMANAADANGTISKVEFFNGATLLGSDLSAPYSFSWTNVAAGTYRLTAKATDNSGAVTTSAATSIVVNASTSNCTTISLAASNWVIRNNWSDQNSGSAVSNENGNLKVTHRQWGQNYFWLISNVKYNLTAGVNYSFTYELQGNINIVSTELGIAANYQWDGPVLSQSTLVAPSGYSVNAFNTKTVTLRPAVSGSYHIAIKVNLGSQPSVVGSFYWKNMNNCSASAARALANENLTEVDNILSVYPNPAIQQVRISCFGEAEVKIYNTNGSLMYMGSINEGQEIDIKNWPAGMYQVLINQSGVLRKEMLIKL